MSNSGVADEKRRSLLVVEDEAMIAVYLVEILEELGFDVCGQAASRSEALAIAERHRPFLALVDVQLRGADDGVETARDLKDLFGTDSLLLSGAVDAHLIARAADIPPRGFLQKPYTVPQLQAALDQIFSGD